MYILWERLISICTNNTHEMLHRFQQVFTYRSEGNCWEFFRRYIYKCNCERIVDLYSQHFWTTIFPLRKWELNLFDARSFNREREIQVGFTRDNTVYFFYPILQCSVDQIHFHSNYCNLKKKAMEQFIDIATAIHTRKFHVTIQLIFCYCPIQNFSLTLYTTEWWKCFCAAWVDRL